MQASRAGSTLELVVNEQQLHNMSQIDLSRQSNNLNHNQDETPPEGSFTFDTLRSWPCRFRDSLGAKLDHAKAKSDTRWQYVVEVVRAFSNPIIWLLCFVCTIIMPVVLLFIGLFNLDKCTASPSLPYNVFAMGFVMTASNVFNLALALDLPILENHRLLANDIKSIIASILNILSVSVVTFLYTLTAYKVFSLDLQQTQAANDGLAAPTCNETLYSVSFWFITLTLSLSAILSALGALLFLYNRHRLAIIRGSAPRSHSQQTNLPSHQATPNLTTTNRL